MNRHVNPKGTPIAAGRTRLIAACAATALLAALTLGCGDSAGEGNVTVTTYGEDFIEKEIPAATGGGEGLVDGYKVTYTKFLVALADLRIADRDGTVAAELAGPVVFDVHKAGPHTVTTFEALEARRWDRVSVSIKPAGGGAKAGNAAAADLKLMTDNGYGVYVEGKGEKAGKAVSFAWGFALGTRYKACHEKSTGEGVAVPSGGVASVELTIHGDHLFYDDLQSSDPSLRFAAVATADADSDGEVTLEELSKVDLTTLPGGQYGTGGAADVKNLRQFVEALSRTLLHYQGEGHCHSAKL